MAVVQGQERTQKAGAINPDRQVVDVLPKIYTLDPQSTPMLTVLTNKGRVKKASSWEVKHLEAAPVPEWDVTTAEVTGGVSPTVPVANGDFFRMNDLVYNPATREGMLVLGVTGNDLTVERGTVGTPATVANGQQLLNLGGAEPEGANAPVAIAPLTSTVSNYTQIMREPVHLSRTLDQVSLYGGPQRAYLRRMAGAKHSRDWEQTLLFGQKKNGTDAANGGPQRFAGGLDEHIQTNELDVSGASGVLSEAALRDFVGDCYRYKVDGGNGRKALIAGRAVIDTMESWGASVLRTEPGGDKYGFQIKTWVSTYGIVDVVWHPLLENGNSDKAYVVDMSGIMIRPLQRTVLRTNIQDNDEDGYMDEYLTEQSFSFINEKAFGRIQGVTYSV